MPELPPQRFPADPSPQMLPLEAFADSFIPGSNSEPSRARMLFSALAVLAFAAGLWAWIEWRSSPPPPPVLPAPAPLQGGR